MKHFGSLQAMSFFAVLFSLSEAFADNPHFTPMSLSPSSFASPSTVKTAGVYWMPDYIGRIGGYGYGNRTNDDELINGGKYASCTNYGLAASCPPQQNGIVVTPHRSLPATKDALVLTAINTMHPTASLPLIPQALPAAENTPIALSTFRKPA